MTGMLVVTTDQVPGYRIRAVLGEVVGVTARTHNPFAEGVKSLDGKPNPRLTGALLRWREDAVTMMIEAAAQRGANAIIGMRFDNRWITQMMSEICAYGTAVSVDAIVLAEQQMALVPLAALSDAGPSGRHAAHDEMAPVTAPPAPSGPVGRAPVTPGDPSQQSGQPGADQGPDEPPVQPEDH